MLKVGDIKERVNQTEGEMADYRTLALQWEKMWRLDAGFTSPDAQIAVKQHGREQVTTPEPYNAVNLAQRLIATSPTIHVPHKTENDEGRQNAYKKERWLGAMWQRLNWQANTNLIANATTNALVRGANIFEVKWIDKKWPEQLRKMRLPFNVRVLDPLNVGIQRGPLYTEWAYHKYEAGRVDIEQRYPKLKLLKELKEDEKDKSYSRKYCVTDFWWTNPTTGIPWNGVLVDDEFAVKPQAMEDYPFIPFIEGYGDSAPFGDAASRRLSLLAGINGLWQYHCRLVSSAATGVLWHTWPHFMLTNEFGAPMNDIEIRPGSTSQQPWGTKAEIISPQFNMQGLQTMIDAVQQAMQQATFPAVMYGDSGNMQAGFGVQMLQQSAINRTQSAREYLEMSIQSVNELALALVDSLADTKGVEMYAMDKTGNVSYTETLTSKDIDGYYRNIVTLKPNVPQDSLQLSSMLMQMKNANVLSSHTVRENINFVPVPDNEETRIWAEQALLDPAIVPRVKLLAMREYFPETWEMMIQGSPMEEAARQMWPEDFPPPEPPPMPMMPPPMPPGMPPGGGMLPPPGPPMGGMPPPGPPEMMGPPPGMPMQPEMQFVPPDGGGIPPVMQGMLEPEHLGLAPAGEELLFQQATQQPLTEAEMLRLIAGQPR